MTNAAIDRARKSTSTNIDVEGKRLGRRHWSVMVPISKLSAAEIMSGAEIERLTGLSIDAAARAAKLGRFPPARRIGRGVWAFSRADILAWLARQHERAAT